MLDQEDKTIYTTAERLQALRDKYLNEIMVSYRDPTEDYETPGTLFGMPIVVDDSLPENTVMIMQDSSINQVRVCRCGHPEEHHVTSSICALGNCPCQRFTLSSVRLVQNAPLPLPTYLGQTDDGSQLWTNVSPSKPFNYDEFLGAITSITPVFNPPSQAEKPVEALQKPAPPVEVVKKRKERKLAIDKDI